MSALVNQPKSLSMVINSFFETSKRVAIAFGALLALSIPTSSALVAQSPPATDASVELTKAREQVRSTELRHETIKQLAATGSASQQALRLADLRHKLALLELSDLLTPENRDRNQLVKAKLIYNFRRSELTIAQGLFKRSSITEAEHRRVQAAFDVAKANLKSAESFSKAQQKMQTIRAAYVRMELAQKELEIAIKLFQTGSMSQMKLDKAKSKLKIAAAEWNAAKSSLGARAVQMNH